MPQPTINIDFEGNGDTTQNENNNETNHQQEENREESHLNHNSEEANLDNQNHENDENNHETDENNNNSSTGELEPGTELDVDGVIYTVAENGDIVDKDGNVFKAAADVKAWLDEQNVDNNDNPDNELSIDNIISKVGVNITDEEGKAVEFTNDAEGIKSYLDNVMELRTAEIQEATLNKLFEDAPIVKDFIDYITINGTPRGFGEIRDLSGIKLDKENETQLENVIRAAAKEFGNTTLSESYIKYLKDSGGLYDEASKQLQAMIDRDNAAAIEREKKAKQVREEQEKSVKEYWSNVSKIIESKEIAGYKIPDSFIVERDGRKLTLTPKDFYNFISVSDKETGRTGYQTSLDNMSPEDLIQHELLDAYLHFTGKSYKDLISMAVKEDNVKRLKIVSSQNKNRSTVKVLPKTTKKVDINQIVLS